MIPKFRAWDKENKKMYGCYGFDDLNMKVYRCNLADREFRQGQLETVHAVEDDLNNFDLMQSTGLKDKNGVEIFEGDIVHRKVHLILFGSDLNKWIDEYACVEWKYGGWHVGEDLLDLILDEGVDRHTLCRQTAIEIAGNIHEDKELLEAIE